MTEAVKPPIQPAGKPDPITEGVQARLRHLREVVDAFSGDLREMERLEKLLLAAVDRSDWHAGLIDKETQLLAALLKRDASKPAAKPISVVSIVDRVEEDLAALITSGVKAG